MQDFLVNAAMWVGPDFVQIDRCAFEDMRMSDVDEASLAQFEAMLPAGPCTPVDAASQADGGPDGIGDVSGVSGGSGIGASGIATLNGHATALSRNEAGRRSRDERAAHADAVVSNYTIHHARLGVVHVQQSSGAGGGVGALSLRTDDDALRARLRDAMPALRGALADGDGRGPDLSVDA